MTVGAWEIVGHNTEELPLGKTLGDALRALVRKRFRSNAAKAIETRWGLDPKTSKNAVEGHCSERTLTKAAHAEGWDLWMALGEELIGHSHEDHLNQMIEETRRAADRLEARRERVRDLEARARRLADLGAGMAP